MATENIPSRLHCVAEGNVLTGANEILDDDKGKKQTVINQENDQRLETLEAAVGTGGSVDSRIESAKTEIVGGASSDCNTLGKAEALISTNANDIAALQEAYAALTQNDVVAVAPSDTWPVATPEQNIIYRVVDRTNTPPQYYTDYMWNGTAMVQMAQYNNAIDPRPKKGSQNLVTSGGVFDNMGALDVSELNATENPHTLAKYVDLSAALAAIPTDYQKGGMSIKFVLSSDNKYVQFRYMSSSTAIADFINVNNWQGIDKNPIRESDNLVTSDGISLFGELIAEGGGELKLLHPNLINGKYISPQGDVVSASGFSYSEPIALNRGDFIILDSGGYNGYAQLSKVITADIAYEPLFIKTADSSSVLYYIADASVNIAICGGTSTMHLWKIERIANIIGNSQNLPVSQKLFTDITTELRDKLIEIKAWGGDSWNGLITKVGDVAYNPQSKLLRKCIVWITDADHSTYETVPYYEGSIYTYNNKLYLWNGSDLVGCNTTLVKNELSGELIANCEEHSYKLAEKEDIELLYEFAGAIKELAVDFVTNKYITPSGEVSPASGFCYSKPIHLIKGEVIKVKTQAGSYGYAQLSKVLVEDSSYEPIYVENDRDNTGNILYRAKEEIDVAVCGMTNGVIVYQISDVNSDGLLWIQGSESIEDFISTPSYDTLIDAYDELLVLDPDYIKKSLISKDSTDTYNIYKYVFEPKNYEKTVFIVAGMHGDEYEGYWGIYNVMKNITLNYITNPALMEMRNTTRFIVIPACNPYGVNNRTRNNGNDVNAEFNFPQFFGCSGWASSGSSPFIANESSAIRSVYEEYKDEIDLYVDSHTHFNPRITWYASYIISNNISRMGSQLNAVVAVETYKERVLLGSDKHSHIGNDPTAFSPLWMQGTNGIPAIIMEFVPMRITPSNQGSAEEMDWAASFYGNSIYMLSKDAPYRRHTEPDYYFKCLSDNLGEKYVTAINQKLYPKNIKFLLNTDKFVNSEQPASITDETGKTIEIHNFAYTETSGKNANGGIQFDGVDDYIDVAIGNIQNGIIQFDFAVQYNQSQGHLLYFDNNNYIDISSNNSVFTLFIGGETISNSVFQSSKRLKMLIKFSSNSIDVYISGVHIGNYEASLVASGTMCIGGIGTGGNVLIGLYGLVMYDKLLADNIICECMA